MPRVSVLLTTWNNPMFLEALESIQAQTFKDYEIIVLDDNSDGPDQPSVPCGGWKNVRYYKSNIRDEDRWKSARYAEQINVGLKLAEGDIIAYLADDDLWLPNKLERVIKAYDEHPEVAVVLGHQVLQERVENTWVNTGWRQFGPQTRVDADLDVLEGDPWCRVDHSSVTHLRACYLNVGGWPTENPRMADAYYWRRLYTAGYPFYVIRDVLDIHRFHPKSISARMDRGEHLGEGSAHIS